MISLEIKGLWLWFAVVGTVGVLLIQSLVNDIEEPEARVLTVAYVWRILKRRQYIVAITFLDEVDSIEWVTFVVYVLLGICVP